MRGTIDYEIPVDVLVVLLLIVSACLVNSCLIVGAFTMSLRTVKSCRCNCVLLAFPISSTHQMVVFVIFSESY